MSDKATHPCKPDFIWRNIDFALRGLAGPDRLKVSREMPDVKNRVEEIVRLLKELG